MRIRSARIDEAAALSELAFASKSTWPYDPAALARYRDQLEVHQSDILANLVFIAEAQDQIVGFYAPSPSQDPHRLYFMFVAPKFQRRGYGRALWRDAVERACERGWPYLRFFADDFARGAFYDRLGCRKLRSVPNELSGSITEMEIQLRVQRSNSAP